jgi:hypothetical protein
MWRAIVARDACVAGHPELIRHGEQHRVGLAHRLVRREFGGGGGGGSCGPANLALNKTATASSTENASFTASAAVDGNAGTRWSSAFSDPQWLEVDLGSSQAICQVTLNWEAAYVTAYQIQTSADGTNWTTIYSTTSGPAAPRPSRSPVPAATSACTARPAPPSTGTRSGNSRLSR